MIAPNWLQDVKKVIEGEFTDEQIIFYNEEGYNIYYLPNHPSIYSRDHILDGTDIDTFNYVFVDHDQKSGAYDNKDSFLEALSQSGIRPTKVIDSGNGIHVYWKITNLDAMSYLRFQRRLTRLFNTDEAVGKIFQLMRLENTWNTKVEGKSVKCEQLYADDVQYSAEEFDKLLPPITQEDEQYCQRHYDTTYSIATELQVSGELPPKFGKLLRENKEVKEIWIGETNDRSKDDYRLGHLLYGNDFTKEEAMNVLVNTAKAIQRNSTHRQSYARNIIDKIWTYEETGNTTGLSSSVKDILSRPTDNVKGTRIPCWKYVDDTKYGFRLGHVCGLVAGSGVGKTSMSLNMFMGFTVSNPDMHHFFVPLEQTDIEIAEIWKTMCGDKTHLYDKVHILSNYDENGIFRDLSLEDIKNHIKNFQETMNKKVGCVVIDHIGVLCNENALGQEEGVKKIAKAMKGFAEETQTFLIMQSQTSRSKAGIGDIELDKDAAFGTSVFENFCDFLITLWQPLKRVYTLGAPTTLAYKFCKIRHKNQKHDIIKEDERYTVVFDSETQLIREVIQSDGDLAYWNSMATNKRKQDRRTELVPYVSIKWNEQ